MDETPPQPAHPSNVSTQSPGPSQVERQLAEDARASAPRTQAWHPPAVDELRKILRQHEISHFIARGGMGAVYKGTQKALKREVAIKVLPPQMAERNDLNFSARFKHEAQTMARLSHPNIITVHDAGATSNGLLYFVMEYVDGTDLARLIARDGPLAPRRAADITISVCEALSFAHAMGIIHRDIKPSNIMIDLKGRVKVADFGLARALNAEDTPHIPGHPASGTPDFIAPEALIPGIHLDQRADLYALGVMLYQMLTGRLPHSLPAPPSHLAPNVSTSLDAVVTKAMQNDRSHRYTSAAEMKQDLEQASLAS
ncbi:serine/threonine-protein kinase [Prosthecobacter sp.]|uniref:serine/threonine-protein kinase n=1 Tax=Prosthecobacter sp. TaxID=1965333 RepID=UPI003782F94D